MGGDCQTGEGKSRRFYHEVWGTRGRRADGDLVEAWGGKSPRAVAGGDCCWTGCVMCVDCGLRETPCREDGTDGLGRRRRRPCRGGLFG